MRTSCRIQSLFPGATLFVMILFACATAPAANILQTVTEGAGTDWTAASWGTPAAAATAGNTYETPNSSFTVRTPNKNLSGLYSTNFAGSSLQIDAGGILYLKHGGNLTNSANANVLLNGGTITFHGGFAPVPAPLGGTLQVLTNSTITTDQTGANSADIWLLSPISGSGNLNVNMNSTSNSVILYGNNSAFTGNWTNSSSYGSIKIYSGTTNALGSGSVTLVNSSGLLVFNSTNNMVVSNSIYGLGSVVQMNSDTVALDGSNTYTGSLIISNGTVQIGSEFAVSNAATISLFNGATLDATPVGGLTLNPVGQTMNCNGTVVSGLTAGTADTLNFNLSPTTNSVLNVTGPLTLNGTPTLNLSVSGYVPTGTYRLINYSGTIQGGGSFNLVTPVGNSETFQLNTSTPGQVNLVVTGIAYNITWVGDGSANYWDTTSPNWTGGADVFATGDNVTFDDTGSSVPDIYIVAQVFPGSVTINNTVNHYVFDGSSPTVGITTSGTLTKTGANEVDFTSAGNAFSGPIIIQAGTLSIGNGGTAGSLGSGPITNNGILQVNMNDSGAAFNAPISGTGSLNLMGIFDSVSITGTNSYSGGTTIGNGTQLSIAAPSALGSGPVVVMSGGKLGITSLVGTITVSNPITVSGDYTSPGGALYVNTTGNNVTWSGPITIGTGNDGILNQIRLVNINTRMNFSGPVLGTNEQLECTSGNSAGDNSSVMTFSNAVSLGSSGSLLVDGLAVVALDGTNTWGNGTTVGYNGTSPYVTSSTATLLVNGRLNGGALEVENLATLGGSGTILDPVTVDGSLSPGNSSIGTLTVNNSVTFESDGAAVMDINRANGQNASLLAATSIAYGGTLTVNNIGTTNLQAGDTFYLFDSSAISGAFAVTNLPALPSTNLYWDTSLLSSGTIKVGSYTAPTPTITSSAVSGTNFTLQVPLSASGFNYVLQASPSLSNPVWANIYTNAGTGGTLNFTNPVIPGIPQQFFRISVQ